jgi:PHO85 cyclin-6/7
MGSLVMTTTHAPELGQHPYHHIMVDSDQYAQSPDAERQTPVREVRSSSISRPQSSASTQPAPPSPPLQPGDAQSQASRASSEATVTAPPPAAATARPTQSYHPSNVNHDPRGFDQSGFPLTNDPRGLHQSSPSSPRLQPTYRSARSLAGSEATSPSRIKVRDLSHIQSFASEEYLNRPRLGRRMASTLSESGRQYEISAMPVTDIIEMVAGLLTKITTTNDRQNEHIRRPIPPPEDHANMHPQTSCVLAFHGKNVPSITILSYLSRIHKYCPTTYEVFLSLLVYFDRMTDTVNKSFLSSMQTMQRQAADSSAVTTASPATPTPHSPMNIHAPIQRADVTTPPASGSLPPQDRRTQAQLPPGMGAPGDLTQFFVVDSYNIHRLVIAAVTCASKFFSDVFYTNSRYAKVCMQVSQTCGIC